MSTFTTPEEAIRYLKSLGMTSEQIVEQVFAPQTESQVGSGKSVEGELSKTGDQT